MSAKEEKLSTDLGEAAELAIAEHLETLKMENPEEIGLDDKQKPIPNPNYIKIKAFKNRAASDILAIMSRVDPQSMKGRKTDRTLKVLERVMSWKGPPN